MRKTEQWFHGWIHMKPWSEIVVNTKSDSFAAPPPKKNIFLLSPMCQLVSHSHQKLESTTTYITTSNFCIWLVKTNKPNTHLFESQFSYFHDNVFFGTRPGYKLFSITAPCRSNSIYNLNKLVIAGEIKFDLKLRAHNIYFVLIYLDR